MSQEKCAMYMHNGSHNHGCEAIVRSTAGIIGNPHMVLYSQFPREDDAAGLNRVCVVRGQGAIRDKRNPIFIGCKVLEILIKSDVKLRYLYRRILSEAKKGDLFLSIGGDNYCYSFNSDLIFINRELNAKGCKTALWGCSIEPSLLKDPQIIADLNRYSLIAARESITYNALLENGINKNTALTVDPAFALTQQEATLPEAFEKGNTIGVNLSPLVMNPKYSGENARMVYDNYRALIRFILQETSFKVMLIPHVMKRNNNDLDPMRELLAEFPDRKRICILCEDNALNCMQLKYAIASCHSLVAARTHASIAAYSSGVPCLVLGYSVKSKGIAADLFGSDKQYVLSAKDLHNENVLTTHFRWILDRHDSISENLRKTLPEYIGKTRDAVLALKKLEG